MQGFFYWSNGAKYLIPKFTKSGRMPTYIEWAPYLSVMGLGMVKMPFFRLNVS